MSPGGRGTRGAEEWSELRRRVEALATAIHGEQELSPDEARAVLEERARLLARPVDRGVAETTVELVAFSLAGASYAVESAYVLEAFRPRAVALLNGPDAALIGITAWRGELLPLLDLERLTGAPAYAPGTGGLVVVLGQALPAFGVVVDAIDRLISLPPSHIRRAGGVLDHAFVRGVTPAALVVLDVPELIRNYREDAP